MKVASGEVLRIGQPTPGKAGDAVLVAVRPENIVLRGNGDAADAVNSFPARVIEGHFHGTQTTYAIETLGHRLEAIELGTVPRFSAEDFDPGRDSAGSLVGVSARLEMIASAQS